jgi:hypothetical protein
LSIGKLFDFDENREISQESKGKILKNKLMLVKGSEVSGEVFVGSELKVYRKMLVFYSKGRIMFFGDRGDERLVNYEEWRKDKDYIRIEDWSFCGDVDSSESLMPRTIKFERKSDGINLGANCSYLSFTSAKSFEVWKNFLKGEYARLAKNLVTASGSGLKTGAGDDHILQKGPEKGAKAEKYAKTNRFLVKCQFSMDNVQLVFYDD